MKTKLLPVLLLSLMLAICGSQSETQAQVYVSVYARIPLAPNVVLTVDVPVIGAPSPDYVWIDGYWTWSYSDRAYVWVQGYWTLAPYINARWIPGYWEHYRGGYRWIDACWIPRNHYLHYGYCDGRYDYYGRPVYYHRPANHHPRGYAYTYDHNPDHRRKGYNSSAHYNAAPQRERERIDRQHANPRSVSENNNRKNSSDNRTERSHSQAARQDHSNNRENTASRTENRSETTRTRPANNPDKNENAAPARREHSQPSVSGNTGTPRNERSERANASTRSSNHRESDNARESGQNDNSRRR